MAVWDWTTPSTTPILTKSVGPSRQTQLKVNPKDEFEFMTMGPDNVFFFTFELESGIKKHEPIITEK